MLGGAYEMPLLCVDIENIRIINERNKKGEQFLCLSLLSLFWRAG